MACTGPVRYAPGRRLPNGNRYFWPPCMTTHENTQACRAGGPMMAAGEDHAVPIVDMLLSRSGTPVVDSETLITEIQKRVWGALRKGYEYSGPFDESENYLRSHVFSKIEMGVMYVDLVGSTDMTLELPEEKIATIISSFAQEMAYVVRRYGGFVLKFVGDAVIAFFAGGDSLRIADTVVECAKSMITAVKDGINPILNQYDYPDLRIKVGIDHGRALVVRYGADEARAPVDLIGPVLNIAAKIQSHAKPGQVLIGIDVYDRLHPARQGSFEKIEWKGTDWKYRSRRTGEIYGVYGYKG
ncbi:adenylate cyclase [Cenarchaeum symbiosum A]|uniref:Adenylate cyclase n=1 Tax=Cenarchaeum symbiosum (strain A) TaxID=414004 RepID=A0RVV4_CENSY|nr:adenylate cyclase [Cenarchaeum symbiosum A]